MFPDNNEKSKQNPPLERNHLTGDDLDIINELDYEEKKKNRPYDPYERHWDEAWEEKLWIKRFKS